MFFASCARQPDFQTQMLVFSLFFMDFLTFLPAGITWAPNSHIHDVNIMFIRYFKSIKLNLFLHR